jgi:hypothetical protein
MATDPMKVATVYLNLPYIVVVGYGDSGAIAPRTAGRPRRPPVATPWFGEHYPRRCSEHFLFDRATACKSSSPALLVK